MAIVTRRVIVLPARLQIEMFEAMMLDEILSNRLFAGADALSCRSDTLRLMWQEQRGYMFLPPQTPMSIVLFFLVP